MTDMRIERDVTAALRKTATVLNIPRAVRKLTTAWGTESVRILKRSAAEQQRSGQGRKTGNLARNIDMEHRAAGEVLSVVVGTGVGNTKSVVYARIQDEGGTIRKKDKRLTIPLGQTQGRISDYPDGFFVRSIAGNLLYCQRVGKTGKLKPLFVLKDEVRLPPTFWFSGPMRRRVEYLEQIMAPDYIYMQAEAMTQAQAQSGGSEG